MTKFVCVLAFIVGVLASGSSAKADSYRAAPILKGPAVSIQGYGRQNPECRAWTDGCVLCTSDGGGHSQCSTPGIACQARGLTCKLIIRAP